MEFKKRLETESDSQEDSDYETTISKRKLSHITSNYDEDDLTRKRPRCFSKNALMARENRLRKKMYLEGLEKSIARLTQENRKLKNKVENQSQTINKLTKEVKYVKNVLANSTDILKILHSIHHNTGMLVGTSLDKSLSFTSYVSKKQSEDLYSSVNDDINFGVLFDDPELLQIEENNVNNPSTFEEHNYMSRNHMENAEDDVGVCLHVSKHRVSLEFCSKCNEDASGVWKNNF